MKKISQYLCVMGFVIFSMTALAARNKVDAVYALDSNGGYVHTDKIEIPFNLEFDSGVNMPQSIEMLIDGVSIGTAVPSTSGYNYGFGITILKSCRDIPSASLITINYDTNVYGYNASRVRFIAKYPNNFTMEVPAVYPVMMMINNDLVISEELMNTYCNVLETIAFSDVPVTHTYAKEIEYMKVNGISAGFNNGSEYRPDTTIDRKSLVTLVVKAKYSMDEINNCITEYGYEGKNIFHDVPYTHHFAPFICMAKEKRIAIGYSTGYFGVDEPIKADAAIKVVMRTLDKNLGIDIDAPLSEYTKRLNDLGYYPPTITKSNESNHETTRAEFAYMTQIINDSYQRLEGSNVK